MSTKSSNINIKIITIFLLLIVFFIFLIFKTTVIPTVNDCLILKKLENNRLNQKNVLGLTTKILPDSLLVKHLIGKFDYTKDTCFIEVAPEHCSKPMYLQKETYTKFKEMYNAAKKVGIYLSIISGTRNFSEQKAIWDRKWNINIKTMDSIKAAKTILLYSSMPTTSRHHWGTDIDINSLVNSYFSSGKGLKEYNWLLNNASKYGFCQVYTDKQSTGRKGYEMEKWHWSYIPISSQYLKKYTELIKYKDIKGFQGSNLASKLNSIEDYVKGIDKSCH